LADETFLASLELSWKSLVSGSVTSAEAAWIKDAVLAQQSFVTAESACAEALVNIKNIAVKLSALLPTEAVAEFVADISDRLLQFILKLTLIAFCRAVEEFYSQVSDCPAGQLLHTVMTSIRSVLMKYSPDTTDPAAEMLRTWPYAETVHATLFMDYKTLMDPLIRRAVIGLFTSKSATQVVFGVSQVKGLSLSTPTLGALLSCNRAVVPDDFDVTRTDRFTEALRFAKRLLDPSC
jgi:hypothetical protein